MECSQSSIELKPCSKNDWSPTFSKYHYMDARIDSAKCYSIWGYFSFKKMKTVNVCDSKRRSDKEEADDDDDDDDDEDEDEGYYDAEQLELVGFTAF